MTFLKANWENLLLINYAVDPDLLLPYIPNGTALDLFNGKCYISIVGFMFKNTKVLGLKLKNHINFEEVNLRFYVKQNNKRGVVFIKEIVPKPLITFVANSIYKEHYETMKMKHNVNENKNSNFYEYKWLINEEWQSISVTTEKIPKIIIEDTLDEFITEHYFGYTKNGLKTLEYEVEHPRWKHLVVKEYDIDVDFEKTY
ncbi:YqjF family protein [Hyunsoonleella ulvae]|uniref:YqjF family protein n=1 Tax=Hyunsoonleella ulvae TaxID=2799948 RepID=UPI00293D5AAF|nr:DUF2071 domain-containing protein [Hyunsoonleella ulvae]